MLSGWIPSPSREKVRMRGLNTAFLFILLTLPSPAEEGED
jgi:hypothetical protein